MANLMLVGGGNPSEGAEMNVGVFCRLAAAADIPGTQSQCWTYEADRGPDEWW